MPRTAKLPFVHRTRLADGSPRFRGYCDVGKGPARKRVFSPTFDNERDAHEAAMLMRKRNETRIEAIDLDRACAILLEDVATKRTAGTVAWYYNHLGAVRAVIPGSTPLCAIVPETIERFIRVRQKDWARAPQLDPETGKVLVPGRHVKAATINADLRALHRVFVVAKRLDKLLENPVREVERPRADDVAMDWFTETEIRDLLQRVEWEPTRDLFTLFALTGMRLSEVARLTVASVKWPTSEIVIAGKTKTRTWPIRPALEAPLRRLVAAAEASNCPAKHLIPGRMPKDLTHKRATDRLGASKARILAAFKHQRELLGERRLHPHALRHTFGTALVRKPGVQLDTVMRLMGHSKITTTQKYLHLAGPTGESALDQLDVVPGLPASAAAAPETPPPPAALPSPAPV